MALEDPVLLINMREKSPKRKFTVREKEAMIIAHNKLASDALKKQSYKEALRHFKNTLTYSDTNIFAKYNLLIIEAHRLYETGKKQNLWSAIQIYHKAANMRPGIGEPYFFIGMSYHKLGNTEFDLIGEAYEKALSLKLSEDQRASVALKYSTLLDRQKKLKSFWK